MRLEKTLPFDSGSVTVKELTVGEIRQWLADESRLDTTAFDLLLVETLSGGDLLPADLLRFTDLSLPKLDDYAPSELRQVVEAVKAVNGAFFAIQARLGAVAPMLSQALNDPPAPSPESATAPASGITPTASS